MIRFTVATTRARPVPDSGEQLAVSLVGDGLPVPCVGGSERTYLNFDTAASTNALPAVAERVVEFLPWYSGVHRGDGYKSLLATAAYEDAHDAILTFAGRTGSHDVAIICRNTTEAINHLAYRLRLDRSDVVVTTAVEHHANLLPWARVAQLQVVECERDGTFSLAAVRDALDGEHRPKLLAVTGASNVTGWLPPIEAIIALAHEQEVPVLVDAAQLAPHRPLPHAADFIAFSGHKMYAPFGAGALIGPVSAFADGDPFLAGGGAVDFVDFNEVLWSGPPEREEAGSPNVVGAVALAKAARELVDIGWERIREHDTRLSRLLRQGLSAIPGVRVLGPSLDVDTLPIASFVVEGVPHGLVAARLSCEFAIGVRHGCFCAHPYVVRLLGLDDRQIAAFRAAASSHDRRTLPGAVRASAGISTTAADVERLLDGVALIAKGGAPPARYAVDAATGEWWPAGFARPCGPPARHPGCGRA